MEQRLAAVLAADMVGYSRLMEADETRHACAAADASRRIDRPGDRQEPGPHYQDDRRRHAGRVPERVRCGALRCRDPGAGCGAATPTFPRHAASSSASASISATSSSTEGDIYGDGVNVAARLEQIADAGGICVTQAVYDQVADRIGVDFEDLGKKSFKNMSRQMQVWRVVLDAQPTADGPAARRPSRERRQSRPSPCCRLPT